jgi:hypothetical protein
MGYAALRSTEGTNYWSGRGWSLFATYSSRPVHENADKLSIILFADGHLWLPDCEAWPAAEHTFSSQVQSRLNRETLCHNTLLVDGKSQRLPARPLDLVEFQNLPQVKRVTFADLNAQLYPGVRQLRTLIVRPDYVLDFFQAQSGAPHEFAWLTHVDAASLGGSIKTSNRLALPPDMPWSYLRAPGTTVTSNLAWECFAHDKSLLRLDVLSDGPLEVVQCGFPRDDSPSPPTLPMRMLRRRGPSVWFLAVYRLVAKPEDAVSLKVGPGELQSLEVSVTQGGKTQSHRIPLLDRAG